MNSDHAGPSGSTLSISKNTQRSPGANSPFLTTTVQPITRACMMLSAPSIGAIPSITWIVTSFRSMSSLLAADNPTARPPQR
jgi:hypothetical protein